MPVPVRLADVATMAIGGELHLVNGPRVRVDPVKELPFFQVPEEDHSVEARGGDDRSDRGVVDEEDGSEVAGRCGYLAAVVAVDPYSR